MAIRSLTDFETKHIAHIFDYYRKTGFERAAYLETANGPLVELKDGNLHGADPSPQTVERARAGERFIVHHNHPTQGAISETDWFGAVELGFAEIFVHSSDGTIYWGQATDSPRLASILKAHSLQNLTVLATFSLSNRLNADCLFEESQYVHQLSMHVMNLALQLKGVIAYEVNWGTCQVLPSIGDGPVLPVNTLARRLDRYCLEAAQNMTGSL